MPTISELTSVYTADISDLEAKHAKAMRMVEEYKLASDENANPFSAEGADKAVAAVRNYADSLKSISEGQTRAAGAVRQAAAAYDLETASLRKLRELAGTAARASAGTIAESKRLGSVHQHQGTHDPRDSGHWQMIEKWIESEGFKPGRDSEGKIAGFDPSGNGHNRNSAHYRGDALDVSVRGKTGVQVDALEAAAKELGLIVRDERTHPKGQRIWDGAHIHLEWPKGGVPGWTSENGSSTLAGRESNKADGAGKAREAFANKIDELADELNKKSLERFTFWLPGMAKDMISQDRFHKPYSQITDKDNRVQVDQMSSLLERQHNQDFIDKMNEDSFKATQELLKKQEEDAKDQLEAADKATKAAQEIAQKWEKAAQRANDAYAKAASRGTPNARSAYIADQMGDVPSFGMHDYGAMSAYASIGSTYGKTYDANESGRMNKNYADSMRSLTDEIAGFGPVLDSARLKALEFKDGIRQMTDAQAQQILAEQKYVDAMKKWHDQITELSSDATHSVMSIIDKIEVSGSHGLGKSLIQTGNAFAREQANKFLSGQIDKGFQSLFGGAFKKPGQPGAAPLGTQSDPLYVQPVNSDGSTLDGSGGGFNLPGVIPFNPNMGSGGLLGMGMGLLGNVLGNVSAAGPSVGDFISGAATLGADTSGAARPNTNITNHYHGVGNLTSKTASQIAAAQHKAAKRATGHA